VVPRIWPPNEMLVGERTAWDKRPVPVRDAICGWPNASLSVSVSEPERVPATAGVKVTVITQLDPAARLEPHELLCEKSPEATMLEIRSGALPGLDKVRV